MILSYRTLNTYFEFFLPILKDDSFAEEIIAVVYNVSDQMYYNNIDYKDIMLQLIEKHYNNNYSFLQKLYSKILLADLRWVKIKILTKLNIIFENCDYISIPYIKIKQLIIEGIFRRINSASNINSKKLKGKLLTDALYAESILISIFKDINIFCKYNKEISLIDRIKKHDITSLELIYDNNTKEEFYCCWNGTAEINNLQQEEITDNLINIYINRERI